MSHREPIFNVPRIVMWLLGAFLLVHGLRQLLPDPLHPWPALVNNFIGDHPWLAALEGALPDGTWVTQVLAFIPARLDGYASELPGGYLATVTSFATHLFVHGDSAHLFVNSAWFLAFASPIARRTNAIRFGLFFLLTGAAGALFFSVLNHFELTMLIGASGAISGLMGAGFRFIFGPDGLRLGDAVRVAPLLSVAATLRDRRIVTAIVGWAVINVVFALGAAGTLTDTAGIAWEAHLGGFAAGLLTYGFFDLPLSVDHAADHAAGAE